MPEELSDSVQHAANASAEEALPASAEVIIKAFDKARGLAPNGDLTDCDIVDFFSGVFRRAGNHMNLDVDGSVQIKLAGANLRQALSKIDRGVVASIAKAE